MLLGMRRRIEIRSVSGPWVPAQMAKARRLLFHGASSSAIPFTDDELSIPEEDCNHSWTVVPFHRQSSNGIRYFIPELSPLKAVVCFRIEFFLCQSQLIDKGYLLHVLASSFIFSPDFLPACSLVLYSQEKERGNGLFKSLSNSASDFYERKGSVHVFSWVSLNVFLLRWVACQLIISCFISLYKSLHGIWLHENKAPYMAKEVPSVCWRKAFHNHIPCTIVNVLLML